MPEPCVVTIGTFDGVHRGHWQVLQTLVGEAQRRGLRSVLVTFEPHPLAVVRPADAPELLTSQAEKIEALAQFGIDHAVILRFDRALAAMPPRQFVTEVLMARFDIRCLVMGYDHGFGRGRSGDAATLRVLGDEIGFDVVVVPPRELGHTPISSTRIRQALAEGDVAFAAGALGRPYALRGRVVHGDGRGRALGFPTANLELDEPRKVLPADGIYAVRAFAARNRYDALLHLGGRPTFGDHTPVVEVHLLDFDGDLYGCQLAVQLCARIRPLEHFTAVPDLVRAMERDRGDGLALFSGGAGACREVPPPLH
jgi:riboflavin kinase / FMN adenylyltransferase